jgi:hypothetical protein
VVTNGTKRKTMQQQQQVCLDCAPGASRPAYIAQVLQGSGLTVREPVSRVFGCWTWRYDEVAVEVWTAAVPVLRQNIITLYRRGHIRYGAWS